MIEVDCVIEDPGWEAVGLAALAETAVAAALAHHRIDTAEVVVLGCDDARIAALNADFRGRPRPTNVLSWPSSERAAAEDGAPPDGPDEVELGDIAIALGTTRAEAAAAGKPLARHISHLLVHATLHLLGYDHERPADGDLMERTEADILAQLGHPDPYR